MKHATQYQRKVRRLLASMEPVGPPPAPRPQGHIRPSLASMEPVGPPPAEVDPIRVLVESVLQANVMDKEAAAAMAFLEAEFVDINEIRVSPPKEIVDHLGRDFVQGRQKAQELVAALNGIMSRTSTLRMDYAVKMTKRDLRRHLRELGLGPYASARLVMMAFGGHAIPVDQNLVDCLEMDGLIHPGSAVEDVQAFLERIILQKECFSAHRFFRTYMEKNARVLSRRRRAEAAEEAKLAGERPVGAEADEMAEAAGSRPAGAPSVGQRGAEAAAAAQAPPAPQPAGAAARPPRRGRRTAQPPGKSDAEQAPPRKARRKADAGEKNQADKGPRAPGKADAGVKPQADKVPQAPGKADAGEKPQADKVRGKADSDKAPADKTPRPPGKA